MDIRLPRKLKVLSYYLPSLYIVGGYVRNSLLELPVSDVDVAGEYTVDEVFAALSGTEFGVTGINKKLGTLKIYSREDRNFAVEYTTFRVDSYPVGSGVHTPSDVVFTKDMAKDAMRRDFTVNAIYYSVDTEEYIDYTGGIADLHRRILRTTGDPEKVFSEDGLRILRLVRLASELNFDISPETFAAAKKTVNLLKDISGERIRDEFMKILVADTRYPCLNARAAHLKGIYLLDDLGAINYILPELLDGKQLKQEPKYHVYDVFEHAVQTMFYCPPEIRLSGLMHDIGKPASLKKHGSMYFHGEEGVAIAKRRLGNGGLRLSTREITSVCRLIAAHMYDIDGLTSERKLKMFIVDNLDYIENIVKLKRADAKASAGSPDAVSVSAERIEKMAKIMRTDGTPLSLADLKVDGNDLEGTKVPVDKRSWAMRKVLEQAVYHPECRTREAQLIYLKGLNYGSN